MTPRKVAAIVVLAVVSFVLVTTIAIYLLWSGGEDTPHPNQAVTTLRQS
jgi:ABC-type nickel/cobalt efflux system permease component RcnA